VKGIFGGDKWLLPGGGMHRHESAQAAACREGEEELGIKLPQDQLKLLSRERFSDQGISYTEHYFLLRVDKEFDASMSFPEILDAAWTDYRTMNQVNSDKAAIRAIQLWQASPAFVTITAESQRR
jgi:8-oxo-dGTP pyrophosphatase MutT (NUDIX family)